MFSLNDSWGQPNFDGEIELHKALFESVKEVTVVAATNVRAKSKKSMRKELIITPTHSTDCNELEDGELGETRRLNVDGGKASTAVKSKKRKQKRRKTKECEEEQTPSKRKKTSCRLHDSTDSNQNQSPSLINENSSAGSGKIHRGEERRTALQTRMASKMDGARFRWINEQLYTTTGHEAKQMFDEDPTLFDVYHSGFATQVSKWPLNPLDRVIAYVRSLPSDLIIADFGCGEAKLAQSVLHTVHSFDLVSVNSNVIACNMAHVPLPKQSVDVVVFCLSLMGCNVSDFIREARRVLKKGGLLKICEIASRVDSVKGFTDSVELFGFKLIKVDTVTKMFLDFEFRTVSNREDIDSVPSIHLNPCTYKRR